MPSAEFELLDENTLLPLEELARACQVEAAWVEMLVEQGVVEPAQAGRALFPAPCITRLRKARRLERDFELNAPGVALALELLDEIEQLRAELEMRS